MKCRQYGPALICFLEEWCFPVGSAIRPEKWCGQVGFRSTSKLVPNVTKRASSVENCLPYFFLSFMFCCFRLYQVSAAPNPRWEVRGRLCICGNLSSFVFSFYPHFCVRDLTEVTRMSGDIFCNVPPPSRGSRPRRNTCTFMKRAILFQFRS